MVNLAREWTFDEFCNVHSLPVSAPNADADRKGLTRFRAETLSDDWFGGAKSQKEITGLLTNGWQDGARKLSGIVRGLPDLPAARSRRRKPTWADNGDELNIDRLLRGDWDTAWRTSKRVSCAGVAQIDVIALCGGTGERSADELFWSGASAVVICDMLEDAGYTVRLTAASVADVLSGDIVANTVTLKDSHEPLRIDIVASTLCHAGVFRTHMFHARSTHNTHVGGGMGCTRGWEYPETHAAIQLVMPEAVDAVKLNHTFTREACIEQIKKTISYINGKVEK